MTELQDIWQRRLGITVQDKKHFAGKKKMHLPHCRSGWCPGGRQARRRRALPPGSCGWRGGWYGACATGTAGWRWSGGETGTRRLWCTWRSSEAGHRRAVESSSKTASWWSVTTTRCFKTKLKSFKLYLSFGNVHQHSKTGHVVTLTANVGVVPVEHLAAFRGPAACASAPKHANEHKHRWDQ